MPRSITIKELHRITGEYVRQAAASKTPIIVTDRGEEVAVLANPALLRPRKPKRILVPEYAAMMNGPITDDSGRLLDLVRGDR